MHTHRSAYARVHGHDAVALARLALESTSEERERVGLRDTSSEVRGGGWGGGWIRQEIRRLKSALNFATVPSQKGNGKGLLRPCVTVQKKTEHR